MSPRVGFHRGGCAKVRVALAPAESPSSSGSRQQEHAVVASRPVPESLRMSVWTIRRQRSLRLAVNGEPARKGRSGSRVAISFQRQAMDQMEAWRRFPMTGPVALDLSFYSVHKSPPAIYNAAKHALDALGPALEGNARPRRQHVLYAMTGRSSSSTSTWTRAGPEGHDLGQPGPAPSTSLPGGPATSSLTCAQLSSSGRRTMMMVITPTARSGSLRHPTNPT